MNGRYVMGGGGLSGFFQYKVYGLVLEAVASNDGSFLIDLLGIKSMCGCLDAYYV